MHTINIDGLDWTSKEEVKINGVVYVRKDTIPKVHDNWKIKARVMAIQPLYMLDNKEGLKISIASPSCNWKMPDNSRILRPNTQITITREL